MHTSSLHSELVFNVNWIDDSLFTGLKMSNQIISVFDATHQNNGAFSELRESNVVVSTHCGTSKAAYDDICGLSIADDGRKSFSGNQERSGLTVSDEVFIDELLSELNNS